MVLLSAATAQNAIKWTQRFFVSDFCLWYACFFIPGICLLAASCDSQSYLSKAAWICFMHQKVSVPNPGVWAPFATAGRQWLERHSRCFYPAHYLVTVLWGRMNTTWQRVDALLTTFSLNLSIDSISDTHTHAAHAAALQLPVSGKKEVQGPFLWTFWTYW